MELQMAADPSVKSLHGSVNIYLVHSHELFLRDIIDAKGHQGVKDDTGNKAKKSCRQGSFTVNEGPLQTQ